MKYCIFILIWVILLSNHRLYAQPVIDSVIIEAKHIPIRAYGSKIFYGTSHREDWSYSTTDYFTRKIKKNLSVVRFDDSLLVKGYSEDFGSDQLLVIYYDSIKSFISVVYDEKVTDYPPIFRLSFSLDNIYIHRESDKSVITVTGSDLAAQNLHYSRERTEFSGGPYQIVTNSHSELLGYYSDTTIFKIQIFSTEPLRTKGYQSSDISVYPNPCSQFIIVQIDKDIKNSMFSIVDILGREIHIPEITRTDKFVSLNTSSLLPGIYWLHFGEKMQKIVIQK